MARQRWWIGALLGAVLATGPLRAEDALTSSASTAGPLCTIDESKPGTAYSGTQTTDLACDACAPVCSREKGLIAYADYLHWDAGLRGLTFVNLYHAPLVVDPDVLPLATESLNFDGNSGFRGGLGYRFSDNWDITWNYTYFRDQVSGSQVDNGLLFTLLLVPNSVFNTTPMAAVQAEANLRMSVHDIEANYTTNLNDALDFRVFGGIRLAEIDQEFNTAYTFRDAATRGVINRPSEMDAAGARLGAEIRRRSETGWRLFGRGGISYLSADFHTRQREITANQIGLNPSELGTPQVVLDLPQSTTRFVSVLEGALGVGWEGGPLEVDVGYEVNSWVGLLGADGVVQDLLVRGFFVRLAFVH
jgi:hypothetical protein